MSYLKSQLCIRVEHEIKKKYLPGGLIPLFIMLCGSLALADQMSLDKAANSAGDKIDKWLKAPNFSLPGLAEKIQLSKYRGDVVYVDFWVAWCPPCRKSFFWMNAMQDHYGEQGLTIIAINLDESRDDAQAFLAENPAQFFIAFDPQGRIAELYKVQGMPSSYLIAADGTVAYRHLGFRAADKRMLETAIEHLVNAL